MATKQANYSTIPEADRTEPMQFSIRGLRQVSEGVFEIECKPLYLNGSAVEELLDNAGIPVYEATQYAERFFRMVQNGEMARMLAERMERVG